MKSGDIKRGVKRGVGMRKAGTAPDIGRVGRMYRPFKKESRRKGRNSSGDIRRDRRNQVRRWIVLGWSVGVGLAAAGVLLTAFFMWLKPMLNRERDTTERERQEAEARARKVSGHKAPGETQALEIVKHALAVKSPTEVEDWIRLGPATVAEVLEFMNEFRIREGKLVDQMWLGSIDKNGLDLEGVELVYGDGEFAKRRLAVLTPDKRGTWKMDFAAFARWVRPSWNVLTGEWDEESGDKPPAGEVRVYFARDKYYNGPFMDESQWVAYGMVSADIKEDLLIGYCGKGSAQHRAMESMLAGAPDGQILRATLLVRRAKGGERRQFEIQRVLAEDWVEGDQPFDER
ncbi:MAG: hypothetical protein J0M04_01540 [Verrucomicrobia bacterium]|nr:hypothetical protein [Verrucomicrobiota bacterium]